MLSQSLLLVLAASLLGTAAGCLNGYEPWFAGFCFRIYASSGQLSTATAYCNNNGGGLASIHSEVENKRILSLSNGYSMWIGLRCNQTTGAYYWTDGSATDYLPLTGKCAGDYGYIMGSDGKWSATQTYNYNQALCKHKQRNNVVCDDYDFVAGSGTCVSLKTDASSWDSAETNCQRDHAHLVSIHDKKANDYIQQKAVAAGLRDGFHIGLQSNSTQKTERWTDGSPVNYTNYAKGFPMDLFGHCTSMETNALAGQWMSNQCDKSNLPYVCGRPAYDVNHTLSPADCPPNPYYLSEGTIYSPSYPGNSGNISCDYFLAAPEGKKAKVIFDDFESNKCCDSLEVHEGAFGGNLIDTLTGQVDAGTTYTSSSSNILRLTYTAGDGTFVRGFRARFIIV